MVFCVVFVWGCFFVVVFIGFCMVIERALNELQVVGDLDESIVDDYPTVVSLMRDVLDHGEVHARWADSDNMVEVRQGTATFDFEGQLIIIDNGITEFSFAMNQLVNWEKPMNVFEDQYSNNP